MSAERSERFGDMGGFSMLIVYRQEISGDIVVRVVEDEDVNDEGDEHYLKIAEVEFCTIAAGGGRSPETFDALLELIEAMNRDNKSSPQRFIAERFKPET
jgi:hypothetical protein